MPKYKITDPETGQSKIVTGDSPPTQEDAMDIFGQLKSSSKSIQKSVQETYPSSLPERFLGGIGKGFVDIGRGVGQRLGMVTPQQIEESRKVDELLMKNPAFSWGEKAGSVIPYTAIPGGAGAGLLGRLGMAVATGAGMGFLQPTGQGENPLVNALMGGATGAAGAGTLSGLGKLYNAFKQPLGGAITELGQKFGVRTTLSEKLGSPVLGTIERGTQEIPFSGMTRFRKLQERDVSQAAKNLLGKYIADPNSAEIEAGNRAFSQNLYQGVRGLIAQVPKQEIEVTQTKTAVQDLLKRYPDIFKKLQDTKTEALLRDIASGVKDVKAPLTGIIEGRITQPKTLTFDQAWELRKGLGEKIGQARKLLGRGEVDQTAVSQLESAFSAISNDMDSWTNKIGKPEIANQFKAANDAYKQYVVKYNIMQKAYDQVSREVGDKILVSPQKLSNVLDKFSKDPKMKWTFTPEERDTFTGMANIMQVVKEAGQYAGNPQTGNRWVKFWFLKEAITTPAIPLSWVATFLTTTEAGQKLALAGSRVQPEGPAMAKIVQEIYRQVPRIATSQVPQPQTNPYMGMAEQLQGQK